MNKQLWGILKYRKVIPCEMTLKVEEHLWGKHSLRHRRVRQTYIGDTRISTVFLGLNHSHRLEGEPLWFETMILGSVFISYQERCTTWRQALAMHKAGVIEAKRISDG